MCSNVPVKVIINNYSPKAKFRLGDYSTILTEPEVNKNCFSIFTRSHLNRIRKGTIKKRLV